MANALSTTEIFCSKYDLPHWLLSCFPMKSVNVCGSCHPWVAVATADGCVDSNALGAVLLLDPYGVILQHTGAHRSSHHCQHQSALQHKQGHAGKSHNTRGSEMRLPEIIRHRKKQQDALKKS